jgi:hypothetical protein
VNTITELEEWHKKTFNYRPELKDNSPKGVNLLEEHKGTKWDITFRIL